MSNSTENNYVEANLPPAVIKKLESGAFQSLCEHLRERSDTVPNIDLMTVSGFCRNCLSKWLVMEARKLSDSLKNNENNLDAKDAAVVRALDAMGYDEAAQYVYGMMYPEWKKRHAQKASDAQMEKFNQSKPLWAKHDKAVLAKRDELPSDSKNTDNTTNATNASADVAAAACPKPSLLSNVCCEDIDNIDNTKTTVQTETKSTHSPAFVTPALPSICFKLGVLTISDRAFSGEYSTGDLSGPAVQEAVGSILGCSNSYSSNKTNLESIQSAIVPDEIDAIQSILTEWSSSANAVDIVITTGGTGFSPRDVTPEATSAILDRSCDGLMSFCSLALSQTVQPLAALSRGTAGVKGNTLIANLPGNPMAVKEILPILLPLALQAVADMKQ